MYTQQQLASAYAASRKAVFDTRGPVAWESMTAFDLFAKGYHAAHHEQTYVHTAEELDNLPEGTVIVTEQGGVYVANDEPEGSENIRIWAEEGREVTQRSDDLALPALVIGNADQEWKI